MGASGAVAELARLLSDLKRRSGISYSELARRTYTSSSTLHRYCNGQGVPPTYRTVSSIAQACRASDDELNELLKAWRRATGNETEPPGEPEPPTEPGPSGEPDRSAGADHSAEADAQPAPANPPRGRGPARRGRLVAAAALGVAALLLATVGEPQPTSPAGHSTTPDGPALVHAASWVRNPLPVAPELFGVTTNSSTGEMPSFPVGSVRLWDSRTRWANLEPKRGEFDWRALDRIVAGAEQSGLPPLLVLGGTPDWAAPEGRKAPYDDGSRAAPPDILADWDRFVGALVQRYRGRLDGYELWALANDPKFYTGSTETLVEMTRRAEKIIRAGDPAATIVCPSMGRLWQPAERATLQRFATLGGYDHCDVAGIKLHQRDAADPPETMLPLLDDIDAALHSAGVHPPVWNTGTTYELPLEAALEQRRAVDYAVRFYLVGLYGRPTNLERMYFYNWGGSRLPIVLQAEGQPPTPAALAVAELQRWLAGARGHACAQGAEAGLPANVWQCEFVAPDDRPMTIRWTSSGSAETAVPDGVDSVRRIDGTTAAVPAGEPVTVTGTPVLLTTGQA